MLTDGLWLVGVFSCGNIVYLLWSLAFGDIFIPNLHSRATQSFQQISRVQTHQIGNFVRHCRRDNTEGKVSGRVYPAFWMKLAVAPYDLSLDKWLRNKTDG